MPLARHGWAAEDLLMPAALALRASSASRRIFVGAASSDLTERWRETRLTSYA
jgi:hypothetical protein